MKELTHIPLQLPAPTISGKKGTVIRPGESLRMSVELAEPPYPVRRRLRVVGEVDVFPQWRCEQGMPYLYRSINDALTAEHAFGEKYALSLRGRGETWPRNAYMKVPTAGLPRELTFAALVRGQEVEIAEGGELVVELGIYRAQSWRHPDDVYDQPDEVVRLELPAGSYEWQELSAPVTLPADAAMLLVRVGGSGFSGKAWIGSPRLFPAGGETVIPPFMPAHNVERWERTNWLGENLSRLEWPEFAVCVDGKKCFRDTVFNAIVPGPDFEVPLPEMPSGKHEVELILLGDYATAMPFVALRAEILQESARPVEIVAFSEYVQENQPFGVLVEINDEEGGRLEAVQVDAGPARANPSYEITVAGEKLTVSPERVVRRSAGVSPARDDDGDDIILSTGDAIYVPQEEDAMLRFLAWYAAERLGNGVCFRPVYRWSGTREVNPAMWQKVVPLLEGLGMRYHLMVDGRELPGRAANPPDELLAGTNYLGRQAHERDGAYNYWGSPRYESLYADIFRRGQQAGGIFMIGRPTMRENGKSQAYYDPCYAADMRQAEQYMVENLAAVRGGVTRHTGPSAMFHVFYRAGYENLGAEQMYGPEEVILAALRGASKAIGKKDFGAHLAMQWSSCPQDTQAHADRYFLSLAACYLGGVRHINLEEGLWRMESEYAAHDRFSHACAIHRQAHAKFRKFLQTHPRRGMQRVPLAVLKGRYCGWQCFTHLVWGSQREEFLFGAPEESFELLHTFYPRSVLDAVYRNPCADNKPEGWYTGTPYGMVDIVPLAEGGPLQDYLALAFMGWNTFDEEDFRRLLAYVEAGGTLLLGKPHLSTHVVRNQSAALPRRSAVLERIFGAVPLTGGKTVRQVGKGTVIYFPQDAYPCDASIRAAYEFALRDLGARAAAAEAPRGWVRGSEDVNFAAFDRANGLRDLYLLNIDWWSGKPAQPAYFLLGDARYEVQAPAGGIVNITVGENLAVMPEGMDTDVLELTADRLVVQSDAGARLRLFAPGRKLPEWVEVKEGGVQEVTL
ncbi:MAG: hypothetical protein ACYC6A_19785 [Armatimonadota bacterium]